MNQNTMGTDGPDLAALAASAVSDTLAMEKPVAPTPASPSSTAPDVGDLTDTQDTTDAPETEVADGAEADGEAPEAVALPEGFVVVEPVTEGLVTEFVVRDAAGEDLEIPAITLEYKANGKVRKDRLDQVVKLAQFGVYNQEREARIQQVEEDARSIAEERQQLAQMLTEYEQHMEQLLTNEEYYARVADRFAQENAPEVRAARAERDLQSLQIQQQLQHISSVGETFLQKEVDPALQMIMQALPTITQQELDERLAVAMQAHLVRGPGGVPYLPESRYDAMRKYIVEDLAMWAQMAHMKRAEAQRDPEKERLAAERDKARIESQKAKRQMSQAMTPVTRAAAAATTGKPKAKPPATLNDAVDSAMSAVLSSFRS